MLKKLYKISKDLYRINKLRTSLPLSNFLSRVHHAEQQRYKDLSRIGELRTSPSTDALSLCQERYHDKSHADTPMNPIRSRADMPANQPNDKPRADMHTNLNRQDTVPIRLRSTEQMIVPVRLRSTD